MPILQQVIKNFFAPSFGMENIPDDYKRIVVKGLQKTQHLNVREKAGARIIKRNFRQKSGGIFRSDINNV